MKREIKIVIETEEDFNEKELISDLRWQFEEITGYTAKEIEINS